MEERHRAVEMVGPARVRGIGASLRAPCSPRKAGALARWCAARVFVTRARRCCSIASDVPLLLHAYLPPVCDARVLPGRLTACSTRRWPRCPGAAWCGSPRQKRIGSALAPQTTPGRSRTTCYSVTRCGALARSFRFLGAVFVFL